MDNSESRNYQSCLSKPIREHHRWRSANGRRPSFPTLGTPRRAFPTGRGIAERYSTGNGGTLLGPEHLFHQPAGHADVDHLDLARVELGAGNQETRLHGRKGAGVLGANGVAGGKARVAVQSAGQIDRQLGRRAGVDLIDHRVQRRTRLAMGTGAQQGVDDPRRAG